MSEHDIIKAAARGWTAFLVVLFGVSAHMAFSHTQPPQQDTVNLVEHLGAKISGDAKFRDESGAKLFLGGSVVKPALLLPVYYSCPQSCGLQLANFGPGRCQPEARR